MMAVSATIVAAARARNTAQSSRTGRISRRWQGKRSPFWEKLEHEREGSGMEGNSRCLTVPSICNQL
jgi:hypothetical protein